MYYGIGIVSTVNALYVLMHNHKCETNAADRLIDETYYERFLIDITERCHLILIQLIRFVDSAIGELMTDPALYTLMNCFWNIF